MMPWRQHGGLLFTVVFSGHDWGFGSEMGNMLPWTVNGIYSDEATRKGIPVFFWVLKFRKIREERPRAAARAMAATNR